MRNFTDIQLNEVLKKKDSKLLKYQNCDEYWLVIKEGNYYAGTFDKIKIENQFTTNFDKVFLVRYGHNEELIELK